MTARHRDDGDGAGNPPDLFEAAATHASRNVPVTSPETSIETVRSGMLNRRFSCATAVAVCDGPKLVGLLRLEDLLSSPSEALIAEVMDPNPPRVAPGADQEAAAWKAVSHGESTLAVVDDDGVFVGLVPPDRLLAILLTEHDEDMARFGGFLKGTSSAQLASREPIARRFWHRLPWLLVGLVGAFAAADIVGAFEGQLEGKVILAFFIPGIVYLAGAVGTQTVTLVVRGLSIGITVREVVRREMLTGVLVSLALALAFAPVALWRWGESDVAIAAALAIFAACSLSTVVALVLPWVLNRVGLDPAFGSGPVATVIQDLLSVLIYFTLAVNLVN